MTANQPQDRVFPTKTYGQKNPKKRSMHAFYFSKWPFLHWDEQSQSVFCLPCHNVHALGMNILARKGEQAFVSSGFSNWKDASQDFKRHENSQLHSESVMKWHHHLNGVGVDAMLSSEKRRQQTENLAALQTIVSSLKYLGRQGLSIRGHTENEGNLMQLLQLRQTEHADLANWLKRTGRESYLSHDIQNEILQLMSHSIIRSIVANIQRARYFAVIADESTDISTKQQLSVSLRWVDEKFAVHEDFIGLYEMDGANAGDICKMIEDTFLRLGLTISQLRGQGYDGASVMSGNINGVSTRIMDKEKRAVYIHCCAHSMNLALQDSTRSCTIVKEALDFVREVVNFVRASPKRSRIFDQLKQYAEVETMTLTSTTGLRPLCPTRWTVRTAAIRSVLDNYEALQEAMYEISRSSDDSATKALGWLKKLQCFDIYFGLELALLVFEPSEACSKKLQKTDISLSEAQKAALEVVHLAVAARSDLAFSAKFENWVSEAKQLSVDPPALPRPIRVPKRFAGGAEQFDFTEPKARYRQLYFEFLDLTINTVRSRFDQPGIDLCTKIENAIVQSLTQNDRDVDDQEMSDGESGVKKDLKDVCTHFDGDIDYKRLLRQLAVLRDTCHDKDIRNMRDVSEHLKTMAALHRDVFSELTLLTKLFLVVPVSSATAERSFSAMRRLKTYLRSTMSTERLNSVMTLHVHKDLLDCIDDSAVIKDFVAYNEVRQDIFGKGLNSVI